MKLNAGRTTHSHLTRVLLLFLVPASGCATWFFRGDGTFVDHGLTSADRYRLDLGSIDLSTPGSRTFTFRGLPKVTFTVGFWVRDPSATKPIYDVWALPENFWEHNSYSPLDCEARLVLRNASNNVVFSEEGNLNDWIWNTRGGFVKEAFVYGGLGVDRYINGVALRQESDTPEKGYRTWFSPRRSETYTLELAVIRPVTLSETCKVNLQMRGGGWK